MTKAILALATPLAALQIALGLAGMAAVSFLGVARVCSGEGALDSKGNVLYSRETCETSASGSLVLAGLGASVAVGGGLPLAGLLRMGGRAGFGLPLVLLGALLGAPLIYGLYLLAVPFLLVVLATSPPRPPPPPPPPPGPGTAPPLSRPPGSAPPP